MFIISKFTVKTANADAEAVIEEFLDALEAMSRAPESVLDEEPIVVSGLSVVSIVSVAVPGLSEPCP